jgi:hypothetical protein
MLSVCVSSVPVGKVKLKCTLVQALRLFSGRHTIFNDMTHYTVSHEYTGMLCRIHSCKEH